MYPRGNLEGYVLRCGYVDIFYLSATSGTKGTDVRGWVTRVSASNSIKHTDRSLTILLRILEAVDRNREPGRAISCE